MGICGMGQRFCGDTFNLFEFDKKNPVKMASKLTHKHIYLPAFTAVRVKYVTQVLSHTIASLSNCSVNDGNLQRDGVHLTITAINRVAKNLALKVKCAEAGVCGQVRPPPPPIMRQSDKHDNYKKDDDTARRPEPRRPRHVHNDEEGWQTVRHQPGRRGPSYCHFCGEGGHVKDNCRHEHRLTLVVSLAIRRSYVLDIYMQ